MKRHRHIRRRLVGALAAFVVFCTTYALILPAVTLSGETHCGKEEHTHTEDCYRSEDWLCGLEEQTATEGHVQDETCWQTQETLICGQEESELHVHDATCYQTEQVLICGQEETAGTEGHTHTDDCHKSSEPLCGKEEHIHTRQCQSDPAAVETEEDWKKSIPTDLKEEVRERVLQVAESQLGYRESEKNFRVNEDGTEDGFTRYGEWAGDCYGDWNNAFTGFVLRYAQADGGFNKDINQWMVEQSQNLNTAYETAEPGHVVFYQDDEGQRRSGILESYDAKSQKARIYAGDVDKTVKKIDRTATQMIGTLPVNEMNPAGSPTEEADSSAGPAEENPEDSESGEQEKSVVVEGADNRVQSGDEITLTALPQGFENTENLQYQWQYNDTDNTDPESWKDLEGETSQKLTILVSEENLTYRWRVGITQVPEEQLPGGSAAVEGVAYKLKPLVSLRDLEVPGSENTVTDETETIYSGDVTLVTESKAIEENTAADTGTVPSRFIIEKKWKKQPQESEVKTVPVSIRYGNFNPDTLQPDLLEGMDDPNPVIMETLISYDSHTKTWKQEISFDELLEKFKAKYPRQDADYTKFYVTENLDGYLATYERSEKKEAVRKVKAEPASMLENGKQYVILNADKSMALSYGNNSLTASTYGGSVSDSILWTVETGNNGAYLKRGSIYLVISGGLFGKTLSTVSNIGDATSFTLSEGTLKSGTYYIGYSSDFVYSRFTASRKSGETKIYEVTDVETVDLQYTITNTKVASGSFGSGTTPLAAKEIPHSKTIDYLGDSVTNADAQYGSDKDLSDSYRLYLDAGPIADENPVNLILVLDTSSSMGEALGKTGKTRWNTLTTTLVGDSGILKDFYKLNPSNQVRLVTFASEATIDPTEYNNFDSIQNKLNNTGLASGQAGGTNYEDALLKLSNVIDQAPRGYSTYVVFLSDGVPTVHNSGNGYEIGGSSETNMEDAKGTVNQIKALYADKTREFTLSTIAYDTNPTVFLSKNENGIGKFQYGGETLDVPDLPSPDGFCGQATDVTSLQEQLYLMCIGPRCDNLVIQDTLSENVDFDYENINILVKAIPTGVDAGQPVEIYRVTSLRNTKIRPDKALNNEVPKFSFPNRDTIGTNVNVENWDNDHVFGDSGGVFVDTVNTTIALKFNPGWSMDPHYRYEISFNVATTEEAYRKYEEQNLEYKETGTINSDYKVTGNSTSSNRGGFYSNDSSSLKYRYKNPYNEKETEVLATNPEAGQTKITEYQKPVVQTDAALLDLYKVSKDGNQKLNGAVFEIYDDLTKDPLRTYTTSGSGDLAGHIEIGRVINGKTYYLKEKTPPAGYIHDNVIFKIEFKGKDTVISILDGNGEPTNLDSEDYVTKDISGRHVTLTIKNEPGKPLPNTGGSGTQLLTSAGAAMIAGSLLVYGYRKRLRGKEGRSK